MNKVELYFNDLGEEGYPPTNTVVMFKGYLTKKDCVWTVGRRMLENTRTKSKFVWKDFSMGIVLDDKDIVMWSEIPKQKTLY